MLTHKLLLESSVSKCKVGRRDDFRAGSLIQQSAAERRDELRWQKGLEVLTGRPKLAIQAALGAS